MRNDQTIVGVVGAFGGMIDKGRNALTAGSDVVGTGMFVEQKVQESTVNNLNRQIKSCLGYSMRECQDQQACYWKK